MTQELRIGTRRFRVTTLWHISWISMHEHSLLTGTSPNAASSRESASSAARRRGEHSQEDQAQDPDGEGKNQERRRPRYRKSPAQDCGRSGHAAGNLKQAAGKVKAAFRR
jgi:hypothetical protein